MAAPRLKHVEVPSGARTPEKSKGWPKIYVDIIISYLFLFCVPSPAYFKFNHRSALQHEEFVVSPIADLLQAGCIVQSNACPLVCSPLSAV
jgi:hypothetical protein